MSDENKSRRCSFELFPDERTGDKIADELIANEKLKERGRFMRAMLVTGAAFAAIDKRLPLLISELLTENTTLDDINKVISSVIPVLFRLKRNCLNYWKNNLVSIRLWIAVLLLQSRVCREMTVKTRPEETLKICSEMTELTQLAGGISRHLVV
uniref:plasmid partitioning/stability family protein n=1 Tax=Salmonella enterica TaxID=28901 RepID=UPI001F2AB6E2|nr:plasmid partitioning/stability family protein [Salmonella enterica]